MRRPLRSSILLACLSALALTLGATVAHGSTLSTPQPLERDCAERLLPAGTPGAAQEAWSAARTGFLTVELRGGSDPDWDLAVFEGGEPIASSSSFTSTEKATALVDRGDELVLQACRLAGGQASIDLRTDLYAMELPEAPRETITMESVSLDGPADVARLERLGLDVTQDVSATAATVALYSDAERAKLADRGFESTTLIPDLAAADAADRAAEAAAVAAPGRSNLPSMRESYRQYNDYTTELKALADQNPTLVRSVEIGRTFENRPIEGVEIAADVRRTDDGRPVYLNFGAHHAREWPSAELPMEFALDLVQRFNAGDPRVMALLQRVRVIVVPVVNVDGFIVSRAGGTTPFDDDPDATFALSVAGQTPYNRKNCRPTAPADPRPCMARSGEGVDLNRNYGAYWGGPGSGNNPALQNFRGAAPFSEPESDAVRDFTAKLHPTVFITNHTFTPDGKWLRQPGFDAQFLPQDVIGALSPDEAAMKSLGDAMQAANGWVSERGYETLGNITGATEDWNYFSQGTYGYTPEARGTNFHANYANSVVAEYEGTGGLPGTGESYLIAGERAATAAEHSVIEGTVPPGATLTLRKEFQTATCDGSACPTGNGPTFTDVLETTLTGPADGTYEWQVNPSGRPLFPGETYTMSCLAPGGSKVSRQVAVARGGRVTVDWASACAAPSPPPSGPQLPGPTPPGVDPPNLRCAGELATIVGTKGLDRLRATRADDVIVARGGADVIRGRSGDDLICARGGDDEIRGGPGADTLRGGAGDDDIRGGGAGDDIRGGGGGDDIRGGGGDDECRGGGGGNRLRSC